MIMKKSYLKPVIVSTEVVVESMIAQSNGSSIGQGPVRPGSKEQQGDWDNIWSDGGSN